MIVVAKVLCTPGALVVALCLLIVYGDEVAGDWITGVKAFFDGLE